MYALLVLRLSSGLVMIYMYIWVKEKEIPSEMDEPENYSLLSLTFIYLKESFFMKKNFYDTNYSHL